MATDPNPLHKEFEAAVHEYLKAESAVSAAQRAMLLAEYQLEDRTKALEEIWRKLDHPIGSILITHPSGSGTIIKLRHKEEAETPELEVSVGTGVPMEFFLFVASQSPDRET